MFPASPRVPLAALLGALLAGGCASFDGLVPKSIGTDLASLAASRALATAEETYELALARYRAGIGSYLQVLAAEAPLLEQKSLQANLRAHELELSINLIRALGGGFEDAGAAGAS